jgi:AraC-like DNA-binding protein
LALKRHSTDTRTRRRRRGAAADHTSFYQLETMLQGVVARGINAALKAKMTAPGRLWTDIAHEFGYYDQMHMVRDFERFADESPSTFVRRLRAMSAPWA